MEQNTVNSYADMADRYQDAHLRDVQAGEERRERARAHKGYVQSDGMKPLTVGWAMYKRFTPGATYVTVTTLDGKVVELTRRQADVLDLARTYIDGKSTTMREMASILGVAPSTVWRALVKLTSFGLIAYLTARGHYGGTYIFKRGRNDGLERFQRAAKERVQKWHDATYARFSRLRESVATKFSWKEIEDHHLGNHFISTKVATLKADWTAEDVAGVV